MKNFKVTLTLGVTAKNEADAKKEFWGLVDDKPLTTALSITTH